MIVIFIIWIVFIRLEQKTDLNHTKKYVENKGFCGIAMLCEDTKMIELNQNEKSDQTPLIIYTDICFDDTESLVETIDGCKNNPKKPSTTKVKKHISSIFSMSAISSFKDIENKHDVLYIF